MFVFSGEWPLYLRSYVVSYRYTHCSSVVQVVARAGSSYTATVRNLIVASCLCEENLLFLMVYDEIVKRSDRDGLKPSLRACSIPYAYLVHPYAYGQPIRVRDGFIKLYIASVILIACS